MRRLFTIIVLSMAMVPLAGLGRTIADLFASEPGNLFPLLTRTARLDLVDYYLNGQTVALQNNLQGTSQFMALDSAYLKLQSSGSKVVEMRLLTAGKDTVIAVIETVMTPVPDSRMSFWNPDWQLYVRPGTFFKMPGIDDFIVGKMPRDLRARLQDVMAFPIIELTFAGNAHDTVVASHGLEQFLMPDEYKPFAPYLKPSLNYRVNGVKIKPVK